MKQIILIKTDQAEKIKNFLDQEQLNYQIFYEKEPDKEDKLLQEYYEAWQNPQRLAAAKQWEQAAINDWDERAKKEKK